MLLLSVHVRRVCLLSFVGELVDAVNLDLDVGNWNWRRAFAQKSREVLKVIDGQGAPLISSTGFEWTQLLNTLHSELFECKKSRCELVDKWLSNARNFLAVSRSDSFGQNPRNLMSVELRRQHFTTSKTLTTPKYRVCTLLRSNLSITRGQLSSKCYKNCLITRH
jgi:hypothetical protein